MEIGSGSGYPSSALSNFAPHKFTFDEVECYSMEGFLQSLKFQDLGMQEYVCTLVGKAAKFKGKNKKWWRRQILYWRGKEYNRHSDEYQQLLDSAYNKMYEDSESFRKALKAAGPKASFTHSMGKSDPNKTVLTKTEFCSRLMKLKNFGKI